MNCRWLGHLLSVSALIFAICASAPAADDTARDIRFNRDIRPLLAENCFACHGPDKNTREASLRLDTKEGAFAELESGGVVLSPGDLAKSELFARITTTDADERMPPVDSEKQLTPQQIDLIRRWILDGAKWQGHWAFEPLVRPEPPAPKSKHRIENAVDRFIQARLADEGLKPSPTANRMTLIRRLSFDLIGLPPSPAEVDAFVADAKPQAFEKLVDRLLASPHFGERMAMHWLDLVRYADSGGYHSDVEHSISPYRDYVINAFNSNMPFDRFTREQLAGDLLLNPTVDQKIATGFNRLNKTTEEGGAQPGEYLVKYAADRVRTLAGTWMGATMGCAECHDHKYDPYTMKDFYSLVAFFADVKEVGKYRGGKRDPELLVPSPQQAKRLKQIDEELAQLAKALETADAKQKATLAEKIAALQKDRKSVPLTRTMITVAVEPREIRILPRGNWLDHSGAVVAPAVPEFLPQQKISGRRLNRLDLANWFVSPENPLTARVFVNRLWKLFFGLGLSKRLDDVGTQGEWPTHPQLLDWLASEFTQSGWDVKHMVKLLVMSSTYRQSSLSNQKLREVDPLNRFYARQSRWRLDAELIRDNALAVSGLLVPEIGGPSVHPYQPAGYWAHLNFPKRKWKHDTGKNQFRRGLYTHWQRTFLHPSLLAFDAPSREECTAERTISNTPNAALTLLNDPTFVEAARVFAGRIIAHGGTETNQRIGWAWRHALSREPNEQEVALLAQLFDHNLAYYADHKEDAQKLLAVGLAASGPRGDVCQLAAWTMVARALLNLNETITRN